MKLEWEIELGESYRAGQRYASIKCGDVTVFSELVFDNEKRSAEQNILLVFKERLQSLLEQT